MTTAIQKPLEIMNNGINDALVDQLRACHTSKDILEFEEWFNSKAQGIRLHSVICELLRNRSISRATASKWFEALLVDRDEKIAKLKI